MKMLSGSQLAAINITDYRTESNCVPNYGIEDLFDFLSKKA